MDTHINEADLTHRGIGLSSPLGLPDEGVPEYGQPPPGPPPTSDTATSADGFVPPAPTRERPRRGRTALLAGAALFALLGIAGTGAYVFQDAIRGGDLGRVPANGGRLSPSVASLNAPPAPHKGGPALETGAPPVPTAVSPATNSITAVPSGNRNAAMAEFTSLKPSEPAMPVLPNQPVAQASPAAVLVPQAQEAGLPASILTVSPVPVAQPPAAVPVAPVIPATPASAIATAVELRASPLTPPQQVEVLNLVKNIAAQLRDTRIEVAQLHQTVTQLSEKLESRITEFENRLSMSETSSVVQSSARAGTRPSDALTETTAATTIAPPQPIRIGARAPTLPPVAPAAAVGPFPERRTVKDYVVKGASPGLAVLAALNPGFRQRQRDRGRGRRHRTRLGQGQAGVPAWHDLGGRDR